MANLNRNFGVLVICQVITLFGSSILRFALSLYILDLTGSAKIFGLILAISTIPTIFLAPIGGAIADRINRRNLLVILDVISSVIVGGLAIFLFTSESSNIVMIGIVMTLLMIVSAFYQPTVQASIPVLVKQDKLLEANGIVSGVSSITNFAGPVLGGLLYSIAGIEMIVIITCISFFLSAVIELFIKIPFEKREQPYGAVKTTLLDIKEGVSYIVKENPFISKVILIAASLNLFITPLFLVGIPYIIKITLGMSDSLFGLTQGGISLSMIFAAVAIGFISKKLKVNNLYLWFVASGILFIPMAITVYPEFVNNSGEITLQFLVFSFSSMLIMFAITIINIFIITLLQQQTPNLLLGKVMAILTAVSTCSVPVGQVLFGTLIDKFADNVYTLIFAVAVITVLLALVTKKLFSTVEQVDINQKVSVSE
ncbi:MFS transporter [Lysinibacillus sp. G4S2]|uniref:MFS transporter n=1 Tax=Lysinibacillus sp. G4S2 TaxID=3055859 RepID=UPI0025A159E1|nr:MFS transporter [Lysinibacillus sp. G4S2]MDM5249181.1 MFS transporter [Lysinibacillus sp. G4S2]